MRLFFLCLLFFYHYTNAQQDLSLGYQEYPTHVLGHASDVSGNQYYTGTFKGLLTVAGQVLSEGSGMEDMFWVKLSPTGQVLRYSIYGSANSEGTQTDGLVMGAAQQTYFTLRTFSPINIGNFAITPYTTPAGQLSNTNIIVRKDTSGTVRWAKKTNLNVLRIQTAGRLVHLIGNVSASSGAIKVENVTVLDSVGRTGLVYLVLDTAGNVLGRKTILAGNNPNNFPSLSLASMTTYSNGALLITLAPQSAMSPIEINGTPVTIPNTSGASNTLLLRTDTSFTGFRTRVMLSAYNALPNSSMVASVGPTDSLYAVLINEATATATVDGFALPSKMNMLAVLDTTLTIKRVATLGKSFVATYTPAPVKRRIFFRSIAASANRIYLTGQFVGINESPMNLVAARDTAILILANTTGTVDLNGPSKSFIAHTTLGADAGAMNWYGDHREYEYPSVFPSLLHHTNNNRLIFLQGQDNTWNPFVADTSLAILSGAMKRNADLPETPTQVCFFGDGSRLVGGYARGKTAMDANAALPSNLYRRDLFLARITPNGSVAWFNRIQSTLLSPNIQKMVLHNGKAWVLVNYVGTYNDSNYIKVGAQVYNVPVNASLLASVDPAGTLTPLNLPHAVYKYGFLQSFSFFSNGDLLLLVAANNAITLPGFAPSNGVYLLRVSSVDGALIDARKLAGSFLVNFQHVSIDAADNLYLSSITGAGNLSGTLNLLSSTNVLSTVPASIGATSQGQLLKMKWNSFIWFKRFSGGAGSNINYLSLNNNRPVMVIASTVNNQPLLWEGQPVHNGANANIATFIGLDSAGLLVKSKVTSFPLIGSSILRGGPNGKIYLSTFANSPIQVDTIAIGNSGGSDAIGIVYDSAFTAKRSFRLGTPWFERMNDMDIYADSVAAFAYNAQAQPTLFNNRLLAPTGDREPDGFLTTRSFVSNVVTSVPSILPPDTRVKVIPNPVVKHTVTLQIESPKALSTLGVVYGAGGSFVQGNVLNIAVGKGLYKIVLPPSLAAGTYYLRLANNKWSTVLPFVIQ